MLTELLSNPPPPNFVLFVPTHNSLIKTSDRFEISARLRLVSVPFSSLLLDIGYLERSFQESIM